MTKANFGWLIRSIHRWLAIMVVLMMNQNVFRVYLTMTASFGVTGVLEAIPLIGSPLVELLSGIASVGQSTFTHLYSLHTFVKPLLTAIFMLIHFLMIRKQGISCALIES
ncbi:Cytochrome b6 [Bienertia sinuspersici]